MRSNAPHAPVAVYLVADHLDAALAAGEDLTEAGRAWRAIAAGKGARSAECLARERDLVEKVRVAELHLVSRLLAARRHADALAALDKRFQPIARLFVSGTSVLADAVETLGDTTGIDFQTADSVIAYVRSRGLITPECGVMTRAFAAPLEDQFEIAGRIPLAATLDMVAVFLDALDIHYTLFDDDDAEAQADTRSGAPAEFHMPEIADKSTTADVAAEDLSEKGVAYADDTLSTSPDIQVPKPRSLMAALETAERDGHLH